MRETGIDKKQLKNWFTNVRVFRRLATSIPQARRRIWKPLVSAGLHQEAERSSLPSDRANHPYFEVSLDP